MSIITVPFGYLMAFLYGVTSNYGIAIILFSIVIKIILLPLSYKQQKGTMQMTKINPELQELQKKYKNDKEKLNQEMMALYKKHGASPLSGCLPLLLQFPIMYGLYQVITRPLTIMYGLSAEMIEKLQSAFPDLTGVVSEIILAQRLTPEILTQHGLNIPIINFNFFGLNLAQTPSLSVFSVLWLIPLLSGAASYGASKFAQKLQPPPKQDSGMASSTSGAMMAIFPIMSMFFCFSFPSGVGLYWIMQSLTSMLQQWVLSKYFDRKKSDEPAQTDAQT